MWNALWSGKSREELPILLRNANNVLQPLSNCKFQFSKDDLICISTLIYVKVIKRKLLIKYLKVANKSQSAATTTSRNVTIPLV